ncbi:3-keto-disaccharide hydrolase [Bryobacter aggregatus]|uniref:3-keto-disaccharide hydrolase n=1 Tax=Bryobacter aggregatus TaxID=360054 RepID=UPI0004E1443E|nr:DUF1080 domain-containing protein [Bryobacter aggregatus]
MNRLTRRIFLASSVLGAQTPYTPKQSDRPEILTDDESGFEPIFDGSSLSGWEGDPRYWRVEDASIVGEITPETIVKSNTFLIWRGGKPKDFELKVDYRITPAGNSGINYRSVTVSDPVRTEHKFAMRGYQCDIDGKNVYTGQNYEEKGRLFLALRGQMTHVVGGRKPIVFSTFGDAKEALSSDWNSVHLIIRGNTLTHMINGRLMSVVVDDDEANRTAAGEIGVQVHVGPPMKVEYRKFRLKSWR